MGHITEIQYSQLQPHKLEDSEQCPQNLRENDFQARIFHLVKLLSISIDILRHARSPKISCARFLSQKTIV